MAEKSCQQAMNPYTNLSDIELTEKFNGKDTRAFAEIYERYFAALFSHARRMLQDDAQAGDVVQDTFASLLERMGGQTFEGSLSAYLYVSVRNQIISLMRREKTKTKYLDSLKAYFNSGGNPSDQQLLEKEMYSLIESEISKLPEKMRNIFELSRKAHLSYRQIAQLSMVSEGTVKKQVYYALKILRSRINTKVLLTFMYLLLALNRIWRGLF
ncbi:RNA polymerase sigma factor [Pedobacter paludis]|uniref:RNA polymerase subunit sigma-70 n=1 Tax=Pedobacter paludis TaxID=2203212 RepID=A0A317F435_9SPHI|nr:sigma-70 family RNA polymerase sigma factor [Pedobacter paludis]PWS32248.1 RNA polymerase subunit sigma-70 [Pedobacter paludis]